MAKMKVRSVVMLEEFLGKLRVAMIWRYPAAPGHHLLLKDYLAVAASFVKTVLASRMQNSSEIGE